MLKIQMIEKPGPNNYILVVTSTNIEEKVFLEGWYDRRAVPSKLIENPDGSISVEVSY